MAVVYSLHCERCGTSFAAEQPDARFCSKLCRDLIGTERKVISDKRLDNHCTLKYSSFSEIYAMFDKDKKIYTLTK